MNNSKKNFFLLWIVGFIFMVILFFIFIFFQELKEFNITFTYLILGISFIVFFSFLVFTFLLFIKKISKTQQSIYNYINSGIEDNDLGLIIFTTSGKIIWASSFIKNRFEEKMIGKDINLLFENLGGKSKSYLNQNVFEFKHEGYYYEAKINRENNTLSIKDITLYNNVLSNYDKEKVIIGELEIDNYQLLLSSLGEEEIFKIQSSTVNFLEEMSKTLNFSYKQYVNGKFWLVTNKETFDKWRKNDFEIFDNINYFFNSEKHDIILTLSVGFSYGTSDLSQLNQMAKEALVYSKTRGGNQVTVLGMGVKPITYGSKSEIEISTSRSELSYISKKLLSRLKLPNVNKIILYGHKNSDLDALGSSFALGTFLKNYAKENFDKDLDWHIQNVTFDNTAKSFILKYSNQFKKTTLIKPSVAYKLTDKNSLIILLDTAEATRIENPKAFINSDPNNVFIFDHHRVVSGKPNFIAAGNDYIDTSASSASEIITEFIALNSNINTGKPIDIFSAQILLNGIYMDTNQFRKSTSMKTFNAASLLSTWGAKSSFSIETLKISEETSKIINDIINDVEEVKPGFFLSVTEKEIETDVVSIAADSMLNIKGRKAVFVVAKVPGKDKYKMSARGVGNTNVQIIAEIVGGGGHFAAAAAESTTETLKEFVDNIRQAIVSVKNESNFNKKL